MQTLHPWLIVWYTWITSCSILSFLFQEALSDFIVDKEKAQTLEDLGVQPRSLKDMAPIVTNPYVSYKSMDKEYHKRTYPIPELVAVDD